MKLSQLGLPIAAGAIAVGATILTAPTAHALPESTGSKRGTGRTRAAW